MMSAVIPSARRSHLGSVPILSKGKTATDDLSGSDGAEFRLDNPQTLAVMISSTAKDLPEHRKQVIEACQRVGMFPLAMEHLPADPEDGARVSVRMIEDADVYIGIFASRYGYVPKGSRISVTEMEYNRAVELGIPCLIFFMPEDHPVKPRDVERGTGAEVPM